MATSLSAGQVRSMQSNMNARLKARGRELLDVDGVYGPQTAAAVHLLKYLLGFPLDSLDTGPSGWFRTIVAHPTLRPPTYLARAKSRNAYLAKQAKARAAGVSEPAHAMRISPNQSSRGGVAPRVIVLHSMEGGYDGSISWLCNPRAQASAHVCVSKDGRSTRLVEDDRKAWHVANDNPFTLGIEQEGFASQSSWPEAELKATAAWVAYWARKYGIPLQHSTSHGVCRHSDLGATGGGHHDPGAGYPFDHVLELARRAS